jgi:aminoglycoside phosphotransferase (APT) family kinase protein
MTGPTMIGPIARAEPLVTPLVARVPGLAGALDQVEVAGRIERELLPPGDQVRRVTLRTAWYRADGSCSLKYRVETAAATEGGASGEQTVLAWVPAAGSAPDPALSFFPDDRAVPTLANALNLDRLAGEDWPCASVRPVSVEVVRHNRQGPTVLRYGIRRTGAPSELGESVRGFAYGKVYPDEASGPRVQQFLESCDTRNRVPLPKPLGYSPRLRLGLTEALPGQPLAGSTLLDGSAPQALSSAGRTLAVLHGTRRAAARTRTSARLVGELQGELEVVRSVWPHVAAEVGALIEVAAPAEGGSMPVLCHGDFTPSQVLFAGDEVTGIVDLDTVGWGEAAMDLGRFLAHLDLLVAKHSKLEGLAAESLRLQLSEHFLAGYGESMAGAVDDDRFVEQVARFRSWSLATTALHACRQLKQSRLDLALSLLRTSIDPTRKAPHANLV